MRPVPKAGPQYRMPSRIWASETCPTVKPTTVSRLHIYVNRRSKLLSAWHIPHVYFFSVMFPLWRQMSGKQPSDGL